MKKLLILLICLSFMGCAGMQQKEMNIFLLESVAVGLGYEMRDSFKWTPEVQTYYDQVMAGNLSLSAATTAEAYLKKNTHPLIMNRIARLAEMSGFELVGDSVIGIENVDIKSLQIAFSGFKAGLELQ